MGSCCTVGTGAATSPTHCPVCGKPGGTVERITVKAMLRPEALARVSAPEHRFCRTPRCLVVYFGSEEVFDREDVVVPVFQKEPAGERTVCYCFGIGEGDIRRELAETGRSTASERISALVKADRCACEVKNPQGSCCLGNVAAAVASLRAGLVTEAG
jgi:Zinc binding domain